MIVFIFSFPSHFTCIYVLCTPPCHSYQNFTTLLIQNDNSIEVSIFHPFQAYYSIFEMRKNHNIWVQFIDSSSQDAINHWNQILLIMTLKNNNERESNAFLTVFFSPVILPTAINSSLYFYQFFVMEPIFVYNIFYSSYCKVCVLNRSNM